MLIRVPREREKSKVVRWQQLLTLLVHLVALSIRGVRIVGRVSHLSVALRVDHTSASGAVLARHLTIGRLVADGRQLRADTTRVGRWLTTLRWIRSSTAVHLLLGLSGGGSTLALLSSLALVLLFLLAGLPFLADLFEFCV